MKLNSLLGAHTRGEVHISTVSGVASTKPQLVNYFDKKIPAVEIITTKSFQVKPNPGNREPVICEPEVGSFGNSVGLRNPGMEASRPPLEKLKKEGMRALLNVSLSASNVEDFVTLVNYFDDVADTLELNFSCPHAASGYGASIGCDINIATEYVREITARTRDRKSPILVKLTPNVPNIGQIAASVVSAGADGIVAINTVGPNLYTEKHSGAPILNNKIGGKGGASGTWVKERALTAVKEIRAAVGDEVFILGMGGVSTGADAARMVEAGADAVGIGSAFGTVSQAEWKNWLEAVKGEAETILSGHAAANESSRFLISYNRMEYEPHTVTKLTPFGQDMLIIELSGMLPATAGQFAFLFLPGVGEKPFSVAHNSPLTFLIKRRGEFTKALFDLKPGDTVFTRGLYGAEMDGAKTDRAILLAGGSGVAVLPSICRKLSAEHTELEILVGSVRDEKDKDGYGILEKELSQYGHYHSIADDGVPGRVIDALPSYIHGSSVAAYLVGPEKFMAKAASVLMKAGLPSDRIFLSMERMTLCGIGMCGECVCGDRLTCQWGTFMSYDYLLKEAPELL
jgi:dihydroorotate dehydrogenase (subfamily 1) family protein